MRVQGSGFAAFLSAFAVVASAGVGIGGSCSGGGSDPNRGSQQSLLGSDAGSGGSDAGSGGSDAGSGGGSDGGCCGGGDGAPANATFGSCWASAGEGSGSPENALDPTSNPKGGGGWLINGMPRAGMTPQGSIEVQPGPTIYVEGITDGCTINGRRVPGGAGGSITAVAGQHYAQSAGVGNDPLLAGLREIACHDSFDNDEDGNTDCLDTDCMGPSCMEIGAQCN